MNIKLYIYQIIHAYHEICLLFATKSSPGSPTMSFKIATVPQYSVEYLLHHY